MHSHATDKRWHAVRYSLFRSCKYHISTDHISVQSGIFAYPQMESKHSSMESLWALVREQPFESLYTVCNKESIREAWCSVPAKRGAHLVNKGNTAVQRYRFRAKAMSVALRAAYEINWTKLNWSCGVSTVIAEKSTSFLLLLLWNGGTHAKTKWVLAKFLLIPLLISP